MSELVRKLKWSLAHRGLAGTLEAVANGLKRSLHPQSAASPHSFDREHATDTGGLISGANLASGHTSDRFIEGYAAVPPSRFRSILARWQSSSPPHALEQYTFVDLGCGKGRALLLASEYGFRSVVGVELNPALAATARANVQQWRATGKPRSPIRVAQVDAAEFQWPDGPCLAFLFNPFGRALLERVVQQMAEEFRDRIDQLDVLYYKAAHPSAFARHFEMIWCEATEMSAQELAEDPVADPADETRAYRLVRSLA